MSDRHIGTKGDNYCTSNNKHSCFPLPDQLLLLRRQDDSTSPFLLSESDATPDAFSPKALADVESTCIEIMCRAPILGRRYVVLGAFETISDQEDLQTAKGSIHLIDNYSTWCLIFDDTVTMTCSSLSPISLHPRLALVLQG